jgi:type VI secretion system protein ImpL
MTSPSIAALLRWLISLVAVLLLALLVWLFGPLLPQLEDSVARAGVAAAMLLVWAIANLLLELRTRARDQALQRGVAGEAQAEAAAMQDRLAQALKLLRGSGARLAEQPWYVIIGPPGAGKTTALLNSGLDFPLAGKLGPGAVAGVGGTRMCDWWFTREAVLIDTAGRYTTQDSDAEVDRAGWLAFLGLLRRTRPRQPLNGVIVAIALSDIATASPAERARHAATIRARLEELHTQLGVRLPVYLMFTKADLIAGFTEFFDDLDRTTRAQVWGASFTPAPSTAGQFADAFKALAASLRARLLDRLQAERAPERRAAIAGFPAQVESLAKPLDQFVQAAFGAAPAPMLRGVYFTSGTQEGTPIDRLTAALSRSFGIDQARAPSLKPEQGRSYFLTDLLLRVVFGEAGLVGDNPAARRRGRLLRAGIAALLLVLVAASGGVLWWRAGQETQAMAAVATGLDHTSATAATLRLDPVADDDLLRVLPLLDQARDLAAAVPSARPPLGLGLEQGAKLREIAATAYRHALQRVLLPRLILRLEAALHREMDRPDALYDTARVYLMLGNAGPLDRAVVQDWMARDFARLLPDEAQAPQRADLTRHLAALLTDRLPEIGLDGPLLAAARQCFAAEPLAARVYARLRATAAARALAEWRPSEAMGAPWVRMFIRASGRRLTEGIPGFYTLPGFHDVLLPGLAAAVRDVANEAWVLGRREADTSPATRAAVAADVIRRYQADYIARWDAMLGDLDMAVPRSLPQAAQDYFILASPQSPMRALLVSAARQVTLSQKPNAPPSTDPARPGTVVDAHFQALRTLVGDGPGAPIEQPLQALYDLQQLLAKIATAPLGSGPPPLPPGGDPALALRAAAQTTPPPLGRWLQTLVDAGVALRSGDLHALVRVAYTAPGGPAATCDAVMRQPASDPAAAGDLTLLFAPGGQFDRFFNTQIRPFVTMGAPTWKPVAPDGTPAPISAEDLAQLQRAAAIRDALFPDGATRMAPVSAAALGLLRGFHCPQLK